MSDKKRQVRDAFRKAVFKRDKFACRGPSCEFKSTKEKADQELDAHHITDRTLVPYGGYVRENGVSLCPTCHFKAEAFHRNEPCEPGFSPPELYAVIGSSAELACVISARVLGPINA